MDETQNLHAGRAVRPSSVAKANAAFVGHSAVLLRTVDPGGACGHTATYRVDLGLAGRFTVRFADGDVCPRARTPRAGRLRNHGRPRRDAALALGYGRLFRTF